MVSFDNDERFSFISFAKSGKRDFIFSKDVARGMMLAVEKKIYKPLNLGSGTGITIKDLINSIINSRLIL